MIESVGDGVTIITKPGLCDLKDPIFLQEAEIRLLIPL